MEMATAEDLAITLARTNGRLIMNVSPSVIANTLAETDNFLRMKLTGEYDGERPSYFFSPDYDNRLVTMQRLFGELIFDNWVTGMYGGFLGVVVANAHPSLTVDVGISSFKIAPPPGANLERWRPPGSSPLRRGDGIDGYPFGAYQTSYDDLYADHLMYHKRFAVTSDTYPLAGSVECSNEIEEFIGAKGKRVAVVQLKGFKYADSVAPTRAKDYETALGLLRDGGYAIVLVGRDAMPKSWARFGVVDYANSSLARFENDFRIMKRANVGIVGASGVHLFLDILDKPYVQVNAKAPAMPPWGRRAICVPSLYRMNRDGRTPTFREHLHYNRVHGIVHDSSERTPVPPTSAQIRNAVAEALVLEDAPNLPLTERQKTYKRLDPDGCVGFSLSRMSDSFLKDHEHLL